MAKYKKFILSIFIIFSIAAVFDYVYPPPKDRENNGMDVGCKDCNLIMISLSNVSAENMSLYGYERLTTPTLDKWAEDAVVFKNAFTQTTWTLPVATSLFTSLHPITHNVANRTIRLDENIQTLPEILRDQGYKTAAFTGGLDYDGMFGHMRGFEDIGVAAGVLNAISFAGFKPTLNEASDWLNKNSGEKFFLFIHGYDTHCPFDPPEEIKGTFSTTEDKNITVDNKLCLRGYANSENDNYEAYYYKEGTQKVILTEDDVNYLEDLYDEEILSVDKLVGDFLDELDKTILDNTIIVIFSDHGEMFAKHGRFGRAGGVRGTLYDDVIHIPLIMKIPEQTGRVVEGLIQIIDVMPTLLDILDLPQPKQTQGKSLVPLISGEEEEVNEYVFAGSRFGSQEGRPPWLVYPFHSTNESVRSKEWKLIHEEVRFYKTGQIKEDIYELYNLEDDPDELNNLESEQPAISAKLKEVLKNWQESAKNYDIQNASSPQLLPQDIIETAKEHGYW